MRLDTYLTTHGFFPTRSKSVDAIDKGLVLINGKTQYKPAKEVSSSDLVTVNGSLEFVSKGGYKLDKALSEFNVDLNGLVFADIGASTGGFTDCLIKRGVKKVFAVDVGQNQLDQSLLKSDKVVVLDKTNARYITPSTFNEKLDGITVDCSFISLKLLLQVFSNLLDDGGYLFVLIKPQFECGKANLSKNGILKDKSVRNKVVIDIITLAKDFELNVIDISVAPMFKDKNIEYVVYFKKGRFENNMDKVRAFLLNN